MNKSKPIEHYRSIYKSHQDTAGLFGIMPSEFNAKVKAAIRGSNPTPIDWTHNSRQVALSIANGRCCPKAVGVSCVCEVSYSCPDHGTRCRGSHD